MSTPALRLPAWLGRLQGNLRRKPAARFWLGKHSVLVAWVGLAAAIGLPPHGAGLPLCWVQGATGVPCPGCGMTRSLSCAIRGMFSESWHFHPFGWFVLGLFLFTAAQSLLPRPVRERLRQFIQGRAVLFNGLYLGFVGGFIGYGIVRALAYGLHRGLQ